MASNRSAKTGIPILSSRRVEDEKPSVVFAFGTHIPAGRGPTKAKRSVNRGVKSLGSQDMAEENLMLRASLQKLDNDHRKMEEELERTVKDANERLGVMKDLLEKKERHHAALFEDVSKKNEDLEEQVSKYEKKLVSSNINPVTLDVMEPDENDKQLIEVKRDTAKVKVKQVREKLQDMNQKTQMYLDDLQNMKRQIEELEDVSSRLTKEDNSDEEEENIPEVLPKSTVFLTQAHGDQANL